MNKTNTRAMKNTFLRHLFFLISSLFFINVAIAQCPNDFIPPTCIAPSDTEISLVDWNALGISLDDSVALQMNFGIPVVSDNCPSPYFVELPASIDSFRCGSHEILRRFQAYDQAGNTSAITRQRINVRDDSFDEYTILLPKDRPIGDTSRLWVELFSLDQDRLAYTYRDDSIDYNCDNIFDKIEREWIVLDWCTGGPVIELPRLDMNNDNMVGDSYSVRNIGDSLYVLDATGFPLYPALGEKSGVFYYYQELNLTNQNSLGTLTVEGILFNDADDDCIQSGIEKGLPDWDFEIVGQISGKVYPVTTDSLGYYTAALCLYDTLFDIRMNVPWNYVGSCVADFSHQFPTGDTMLVADVPIGLVSDCPLLEVDISIPFIRRCFSNRAYVNYCNYSDETIVNAYVEIEMDSLMTYESSTIPVGTIAGNLWSFDLGDIEPGHCEQFSIGYVLSCAAPLGQTHCVKAHIYPDSICEPAGANWSGASVEVDASCDGDSIRMSIINAGTGNMSAPLNYIVVEEVLMHSDGDFQLNSGGVMQIPLEANGSTWFLSADQEPGHPGLSLPSVVVEGCGGNNFPGQATAFVQNDANSFISIDCQQNQGAYDPNDKQVSPAGIGDEHLVPPNRQLDYLIRFQNTGTDTAFTVVIVDTLSVHLDAGSIIPGTSSHPYTFEYAEDRVVRFTFNNIMLPDSNVNQTASNGFVKFKINQQEDNPDGTRIENSAAIYFDFNEPVITNTTFLTVGEKIFEVVNAAQEVHLEGVGVKVYPIPATEQVTFELYGLQLSGGRLLLYDQLGRLVAKQQIGQSKFEYDCSDLIPGIYWYQVSTADQLIVTGKLIVY